MAREFTIKKITNRDKFSIGIKEAKGISTTAIPEYSDKTDVKHLISVMNAALQDFKAGKYWMTGKPTMPGIYLVEIDSKFNVVKVHEAGGIEAINDQPITEIKRHMPLDVKEKKNGI